MTAISIHELQENTDLWVRKATEQEPIPMANAENPFLRRRLLPGFVELQAKLSGGTGSTQVISEMREGR